jgi:hypothetical protein
VGGQMGVFDDSYYMFGLLIWKEDWRYFSARWTDVNYCTHQVA